MYFCMGEEETYSWRNLIAHINVDSLQFWCELIKYIPHEICQGNTHNTYRGGGDKLGEGVGGDVDYYCRVCVNYSYPNN